MPKSLSSPPPFQPTAHEPHTHRAASISVSDFRARCHFAAAAARPTGFFFVGRNSYAPSFVFFFCCSAVSVRMFGCGQLATQHLSFTLPRNIDFVSPSSLSESALILTVFGVHACKRVSATACVGYTHMPFVCLFFRLCLLAVVCCAWCAGP